MNDLLNLNTSITPQPVYPQPFTRQMGNYAAAQVPTWPTLAAANYRPGISSQSPSVQYAAGAQAGQQMAPTQMAAPQTDWAHGMANAQNQLAGQAARDQEALGWGGLAAANQAFDYQNQLTQQGNLLRLLATLYNQWMA
jgi:hypothetical protein